MCAVYSYLSEFVTDGSGPKGYRELERACSPYYMLRPIALLPTSRYNIDKKQATPLILSVMLQWI